MVVRAIAICCWLLALEVTTETYITSPSPPVVRDLKLRSLHLEECTSPARSTTPSTAEGWNAGGQPWAASGDSSGTPTSPVSEMDSEGMRLNSPLITDALAMLEDWQLPPSAHAAPQDPRRSPSLSPSVTEGGSSAISSCSDDFSGSVAGSDSRRRCQVCTLVDATRGVADDGEGGEWELLLCRHCAQFINNTVTLSTRCQQCRRYATFGPYGGTRRSARHCKRHQLPGEVNVARKRCEHVHRSGVPCAQPPLYGDEGTGSARFCARHRHRQHVNLVEGRVAAQLGRQCAEPGCDSAASFGDSARGAFLCSAHKQPHHVDMIHSRRCEAAGCTRHPSYGLRSGGVARFCKAHKPWNFVDLKTKKCQHPFGCTKRPSFGDAADGIARFCMQHKARQHVNVKSRKCQEQGCAKQPTFGDREDGIVRFCAVHRRDEDVDLVHGRCRYAGCTKIASFSSPGEPAQFCVQHKAANMDRGQLLSRGLSSSAPPAAEGAGSAGGRQLSMAAGCQEGGGVGDAASQMAGALLSDAGGSVHDGEGGVEEEDVMQEEETEAEEAAAVGARGAFGEGGKQPEMPMPVFSFAAGMGRAGPEFGMNVGVHGRNSVHNLS